ncbi:iron ABC transporter substrate-binding protein [Devosia yakushimensis]|uniref:Iron ABC transporter substrate-binding protein n=1 Tax=Devosia yakushimensis TaxID=470028 RepID=A0ABQ5ULS7_9HYPH|nr:extracellular solute-binding protein [Devosia yakushimensis]GLQ12114.1 iron ABC transporter substrate-binding protein [Devosia yakushimensis]
MNVKLSRRNMLLLSCAFSASLSLTPMSIAQTIEYPANYNEIVEASKTEPALTMYGNGTEKDLEPLFNAFKEKYPWVSIAYLDGDSYGIIERYLNESATGTPTASVIVTSATPAWRDLIARGELVEYESPEAVAYPGQKDQPSPYLYVAGADPIVMAYNKLVLGENLRPTGFASLAELVEANPDVFNGKLTGYGAHLSGAGYQIHYALADAHGDEYWDLLKIVGPQSRFERSASSMMEKLMSGEYVVGYLVAARTVFNAISDPAVESIIGQAYLTDGTPLAMRGFGVLRGGESPNTAKLFVDFTLSEEGQIAYAAGGGFPALRTLTEDQAGVSNVFPTIAAQMPEDKIVQIGRDPEMTNNYDAFLARWKEITGVE